MHPQPALSTISLSDCLIELSTERAASGAILHPGGTPALIVFVRVSDGSTELLAELNSELEFSRKLNGVRGSQKLAVSRGTTLERIYRSAAVRPSGCSWFAAKFDPRETTTALARKPKTARTGTRCTPFQPEREETMAGVVVHGRLITDRVRDILAKFKVPMPTAEVWGEPIANERLAARALRPARLPKQLALAA